MKLIVALRSVRACRRAISLPLDRDDWNITPIMKSSFLRSLHRPCVTTRLPGSRAWNNLRRQSTQAARSVTFWKTNRVLLFTAFSAAATYTYGLYEGRSNRTHGLTVSSPAHRYAHKAELESVSELDVCRCMHIADPLADHH